VSEQVKAVTNDPASVTPWVVANTYISGWSSFSKPVLLRCSDTRLYVVKGLQVANPSMSRALVNEQVAGRLAAAFGAPIPEVGLVYLPPELIAVEQGLSHMQPGLCHGCIYLGDNMGRRNIEFSGLPENRPRFARLAILYGWAGSADDQFLYGTNSPEIVYSVDHGHFFGPGAPDWTIATLQAAGLAAPNNQIVTQCSLSADELRAAASHLTSITDSDIAAIVATAPDEWGITADERLALAAYLVRRRDDLIAATGA
jgi:hypothetical protein